MDVRFILLSHEQVSHCMELIRGKKLSEMSPVEFLELRERFQRIWLDIGTGDGLFVYRSARENSDVLCIGLEPAWKNCAETSSRALKKESKGGAANALFVRGAIEKPPLELSGLAERVFVNYPWGSLLSGMAKPDASVLANLRGLCAAQAEVLVSLNYSVFLDKTLRDSLGLSELDEERAENVLRPAYKEAGLELVEVAVFDGMADVSTSWGKHLVAGSARSTFFMKFTN